MANEPCASQCVRTASESASETAAWRPWATSAPRRCATMTETSASASLSAKRLPPARRPCSTSDSSTKPKASRPALVLMMVCSHCLREPCVKLTRAPSCRSLRRVRQATLPWRHGGADLPTQEERRRRDWRRRVREAHFDQPLPT